MVDRVPATPCLRDGRRRGLPLPGTCDAGHRPDGAARVGRIPRVRRVLLSAAVGLPAAGCFAGASQRQGGHRYRVDLHAWYPLAHTRDVVHAIVASTPSARGR